MIDKYLKNRTIQNRNEVLMQVLPIIKKAAANASKRTSLNYNDVLHDMIIITLSSIEKYNPQKHPPFESYIKRRIYFDTQHYVRSHAVFARSLYYKMRDEKELSDFSRKRIQHYQRIRSTYCPLSNIEHDEHIEQPIHDSNLFDYIEGLSDIDKHVIQKYFVEKNTLKAIGKMEHVTEVAMHARLHRAIKHLREKLHVSVR